MGTAMLALMLTEGRGLLDGHTGNLRDALLKAMRSTRDHWMVTEEEAQFRGAIGIVMQHYGPESEEHKRLAWEVGALRKVGAALDAARAGVAVDIASALPDADAPYEAIGLMGLWRETATR